MRQARLAFEGRAPSSLSLVRANTSSGCSDSSSNSSSSSTTSSRKGFSSTYCCRSDSPSAAMSWHEDSRTYLPGVQCLAFDAYQDLLWTGTSSGHVSSYFTKREYNYGRYTAYRGHPVGAATREVLVDDRGVLSVGGTIKLANRRGLALWNLRLVGYVAKGVADSGLELISLVLSALPMRTITSRLRQ